MASVPGLDSFGRVSLVDLTRGDQQRIIDAIRRVDIGTVYVEGWAAGPRSF